MSPFPNITLVTAIGATGLMPRFDESLPSGVVRMPIVSGKDDEGVVGNPSLINGLNDLPY